MTKILVTGGNGQLGNSINSIKDKYSNLEITFTDIDSLDICNIDDIEKFVHQNEFKYIVNCAAYTAVDKAESEEKLAIKINAIAVENLAIVAKNNNCKLINVSTDYVFDGNAHKPYIEDDNTEPTSVYGKTKLKGEQLAFASKAECINIRTSWLYSEFGNNFVKTMIKLGTERDQLGIVWYQIGTPTYAVDLAKAILDIIESTSSGEKEFQSGIYHYSNEGVASWYDFTINIHQIYGINCDVSPIETKEYPTPAPRPCYSVLNKAKIKNVYSITIPHWRNSLERCIESIKAEQ